MLVVECACLREREGSEREGRERKRGRNGEGEKGGGDRTNERTQFLFTRVIDKLTIIPFYIQPSAK